jgi:biotin operon repressor
VPDILETDPRKGFIALPMSVFDLDLTPGAFRTLAELCRMANAEGQCWPSLAQLGDRLGRSRAAISGYIAELRAAELIETETQKMANGYNYRLRYFVVFWKAWRKQLSQNSRVETRQPAERRVQPSERPLKTKNQNHIIQSPAGAVSNDLILAWKQSVGRSPYPGFDSWPSEALIAQSKAAGAEPQRIISADIMAGFTAFLGKKGIAPADIPPDVAALLRSALSGRQQVDGFLDALEAVWKPHWSKPPTALQLQRLLKSLPPSNGPEVQAKLLVSYLKRWEIHSRSLSLGNPVAKVAA